MKVMKPGAIVPALAMAREKNKKTAEEPAVFLLPQQSSTRE